MTPTPEASRIGGEPPKILLQLLAWVAARPRGYAEAIEAWRTSCPRLPAWEDAVDEGLVRVMSSPSRRRSDATIELTPRGAALLAAEERE